MLYSNQILNDTGHVDIGDNMPIDPVCNLNVYPDMAVEEEEYQGKKYYFTDRKCKEEFDKNRDLYANRPDIVTW